MIHLGISGWEIVGMAICAGLGARIGWEGSAFLVQVLVHLFTRTADAWKATRSHR
jgi:hypothetical protein